MFLTNHHGGYFFTFWWPFTQIVLSEATCLGSKPVFALKNIQRLLIQQVVILCVLVYCFHPLFSWLVVFIPIPSSAIEHFIMVNLVCYWFSNVIKQMHMMVGSTEEKYRAKPNYIFKAFFNISIFSWMFISLYYNSI